MGGGAADDDAQVIQSVGAGRQGLRRLEAQVALLQVVVVGRNVGGVGDDQVEASGAGQRLPPAACVPVDAAGAQGLCILLSDGQRLGGTLDGMCSSAGAGFLSFVGFGAPWASAASASIRSKV